tara:strand:- start:3110 stop:3814 length:705 start_codon:yes stop_codon:yes gene_type:complete
MIKKAMILAAGFGKRINPLTLKKPKPLLKIGNETLLSNSIKFLKKIGINKVIINVHYLEEQIVEYIDKNNFDLKIEIIKEKNKILDTGGGVLNAIQHFENEPFFIINPDTLWSSHYLTEIKMMEKKFFQEKKQCVLLVVNKEKSFDQSLKGDFDLKNTLIERVNNKNLNYIYTGIQIIEPGVFSKIDKKVFSINMIWDQLIDTNQLYALESNNKFLHISTLDIYNKLIKKEFIH